MAESQDMEFIRLVDWVEGRLSEGEARAVEERVAADSAARADVAWLRAFARVSEETVIASLPSEVREELIERFEAYAEGKQHPGLLQRLVATLTFDSNLRPALGLRAATAPESQRQLVYSTGAADVALHIRPHPRDGLFDLNGQIFPANTADSSAFADQLVNNDPGEARRLAELCAALSDDAGAPAAVPRANYILAGAHNLNGEFE